MNSFSLRRTLLFSRLQAGEIFGGGIWKKLKVILVISVFIVLFSTLLNAGDISGSAGFTQTMILVMAIMPVTAILSDLISVRLLTPASTLEKYISVYIVALSAGTAASVALALSCSTMLSLISLFSEPPAEWPVLLFVGENFNIAYILVFFGLIPLNLGNKDLLNRITIGFLASRKLPSNVILPTLDWAVEISNRTDVAVMSGFHSRMEKDVLKFLVQGQCGIIMVLARGMYKRIPKERQNAMQENRLLIIALEKENITCVSERTAHKRNEYIRKSAKNIKEIYSL